MRSSGSESKSFLKYKHLIFPIARKFAQSNQLQLEDLIQVGSIGLLKAIRKYDLSRGRIEPFARRCIEREIFHHVRDRKRLIKISRSLKDLYFRGIKLKESGYSDKQVAQKLSVKLERWQEALTAMSTTVTGLESAYSLCDREYRSVEREEFSIDSRSLSPQEMKLAQAFWLENLPLKQIQLAASSFGMGSKVKDILSAIAIKATFM